LSSPNVKIADGRTSPNGLSARLAALTIAAIGVVYGDIGTSPLYTVKTVFAEEHLTETAVGYRLMLPG
jgi:K+ transporter